MRLQDDTKIWRVIDSFDDHTALQEDIDALLAWANINKMIFHPHEVFVVEYVNNPNNLLEREQSYVNRYKTFTPYGLNISNPAGVGGLLTI